MKMKILAVIAEYNPLHRGHIYHLERAKIETSSSHTLVLMGGNFLQRGDVALEEKFLRARKALAAGADLVAELPFIYASSWAREFAQGAVDILGKTGLAMTLSFGSESGEIEVLKEILEDVREISSDKKHSYGEIIRKKTGLPTRGANDILGLEYLRALEKYEGLRAHTVKRRGQAYHAESPHSFPSASSIRKSVKEGRLIFPNPLFLEDFTDYIYSALLTRDLSNTYGAIEGLDHRLLARLDPRLSLEDYVDLLSTRRYRPARIRRLLIHHLVGYSKLDHSLLQGSAYLRPLAYNKRGTQLLGEIKKTPLPIVSPLEEITDPKIKRSLELDLLASRIYNFKAKMSGEDYRRNLYLKEG